MGESILRDRKILFESVSSSDYTAYRKGIRLIFLNQDVDSFCGNAIELGDSGKSPRESFLFSLINYIAPGIRLTGDGDPC